MDWDPLHRWNSSAERRHPRKATPLSSHLASHLRRGRRAADVYGGPQILTATGIDPLLTLVIVGFWGSDLGSLEDP
jgi:hypothetical protein